MLRPEHHFGPLDLHLFNEGRHELLWHKLGAHPAPAPERGYVFSVWAPNAQAVSVVGDFNGWQVNVDKMQPIGSSGVWFRHVEAAHVGNAYKFSIAPHFSTERLDKADPFAFQAECPPATASKLTVRNQFNWTDKNFIANRNNTSTLSAPVSILEVHLGSFVRVPENGNREMNYLEMAEHLVTYVTQQGYTHVELLPISEYPFGGSWGYQVSGYFAPTARYGTREQFCGFVDRLHAANIGVIADWVPAHFPKDGFSLGRFDGSALYEHSNPLEGEHPDWGTYVFNYGRHEVKNFLIANALYWVDEFHLDGLRVDAVASMLYRDYSRKSGQWVPNAYGGRENLEALQFLQEMNAVVQGKHPGVMVIAEESTAWPKVSRPTYDGGLGFSHKWNMGWMHDTLRYFQKEPVHRQYHHHDLTFGLMYAWNENFILPLSHDEVVHGKGSILSKMPGDIWQKFANVRALFAWMWAHPGKKLLFMGQDFGQWDEWSHDKSLDWHLAPHDRHQGLQKLVAQLNHVLKKNAALHEIDFEPEGFEWVQGDASATNTYVFLRWAKNRTQPLLCVANMSPVVRHNYKIGVPFAGKWRCLLNSDAQEFWGSGVGERETMSSAESFNGQRHSIELTLPPLGVMYWVPEGS